MNMYTLTINNNNETLLVRALDGHEQLGAAYHILATVAPAANATPLYERCEELLGAAFTLTLDSGNDDAGKRRLQGTIEAVRCTDSCGVLTLVPTLAQLALCGREAVMVAVNAPTIAKAMMAPLALTVEERLQRIPAPRPQWLRNTHSDLAWMTQALAEQGVQWWLEHDEQGAATVVLGNNASAHHPILGHSTLPYGHGTDAGLDGPASVYAAQLHQRLVHDEVTLRTVNVNAPKQNLTVHSRREPESYHGSDNHNRSSSTRGYELYRCGDRYADSKTGETLANTRLAQLRRERVVLRAKSQCRRLEVGRRFTLTGAPHPQMNGEWLVTRMRWQGWQPLAASAYPPNKPRPNETPQTNTSRTATGEENTADERRPAYEVTFEAVPVTAGWAPPLPTQKHCAEVLRATVSTTANCEIATDALGRVTPHYALDRENEHTDKTGAPTRVLQPAMSGGWLLPRVGWEVLVAAGADCGAKPVVLGRLDNGAVATAEPLPAKKVRSVLGSPTSPGGGPGNALTIDDAAGAEGFALATAGDYNERTENNKSCTVKGNETITIGGNQTSCSGALSIGAKAALSLTVGGPRQVSAGDGMVTECNREVVGIAGTRTIVVGGDYHSGIGGSLTRSVGAIKNVTATNAENLTAMGTLTTTIGGALTQSSATVAVTVGGASSVTAGGPVMIRCGKYSLGASMVADTFGTLSVKAGAAAMMTAGAVMNLSLGNCNMNAPTIVIKASGALTISGGGASISMTPANITFAGPFKSAEPEVASSGMVKHG